jgi:hypothetical protein
MSNKNRLLLSYLLSLAFLAGFVAGFAVGQFGLGILFFLLLMLARWAINPVRKAGKNVWHTRAGKVTTSLFALGGGALVLTIVLGGPSALPGWLIRAWCYGSLLPVAMVVIGLTVREEIKSANIADTQDSTRGGED